MDYHERQEALRRIVAVLDEQQVTASVLAEPNRFAAILAVKDISQFESSVRKVLKGYCRVGHESTPTSSLETLYFDGTGLIK